MSWGDWQKYLFFEYFTKKLERLSNGGLQLESLLENVSKPALFQFLPITMFLFDSNNRNWLNIIDHLDLFIWKKQKTFCKNKSFSQFHFKCCKRHFLASFQHNVARFCNCAVCQGWKPHHMEMHQIKQFWMFQGLKKLARYHQRSKGLLKISVGVTRFSEEEKTYTSEYAPKAPMRILALCRPDALA